MAGMLYLVPTPIGNLGDISPRCAETLAQADFIAAEDTRVSRKLLNHLGLKKPMVSYYRHNTQAGGQAVLERLLAGEQQDFGFSVLLSHYLILRSYFSFGSVLLHKLWMPPVHMEDLLFVQSAYHTDL